MSLRAVPARLFSIVCDTCGLETVAQKLPVEAEVRAAEAGWRAERNPLRHSCPGCAARPAVSPKAPNVSPEPRNVSPNAGR